MSNDTNDQTTTDDALPGSPREIRMGIFSLPLSANVFENEHDEEAAARVILPSRLAGRWVAVSLRGLLRDISLEPSIDPTLREQLDSLVANKTSRDRMGDAIVGLVPKGFLSGTPVRDEHGNHDIHLRPTPQFVELIFAAQGTS